jgi:hypothetical protein
MGTPGSAARSAANALFVLVSCWLCADDVAEHATASPAWLKSPVKNTIDTGPSERTNDMAASHRPMGVAHESSGIPKGSAASEALSVWAHDVGNRGHASWLEQ